MNTILLEYPVWFLAFCLIFGLVVSALTYWSPASRRPWSSTVNRVLALIRGLVAASIAFLLLGPFIRKEETRLEKPTVIIAVDNSQSMGLTMDSTDLEALSRSIEQSAEKIGQSLEVDLIRFGGSIDHETPDFSDKETDISGVMNYALEQYDPDLLGAMVLVSDGMYNRGYDPVYVSERISSPIFSVAIGDTTIRKDIAIKQVYHNAIAFLGDQFPIQADIEAFNTRGNRATISLYEIVNGKSNRIDSETIDIDSDHYFESVDFLVEAKRAGIAQYVVRVSGVENEWSDINNRKSAYVEIIDARQRVAIIGDSPHPDIAAIKQALDTRKNYEIEIMYASAGDLAAGQNTIPTNYDLVILHNLPSTQYNMTSILQQLNNRNVPRWFITGSKTETRVLNKKQDILGISGNGRNTNNVLGNLKSGFNLFTLDNEWMNGLENYPPLQSPFAQYQAAPNTSVLMNQQIGSVETDFPLFIFSRDQKPRTAITTAEGLWRWRIHNYTRYESHEQFDEFIAKIVQYIGVQDDKRKFRLQTAQNVYDENEKIVFDAQLYNDSYELISEPDVSLTVRSADKDEYTYTMEPSELGYRLNIGTLPIGQYTATARSEWNGEKYASSTRFSIRPLELELYRSQADHPLLKELAIRTKGQLLYPDQISQLAERVLDNPTVKPVAFQETQTRKLLDNPLWLALIIALLAAEWITRRYHGSY